MSCNLTNQAKTLSTSDLNNMYLYGPVPVVLEAVEVMLAQDELYEQAGHVLKVKQMSEEVEYPMIAATIIDDQIRWTLAEDLNDFWKKCKDDKGFSDKYLLDMNKMKTNKPRK